MNPNWNLPPGCTMRDIDPPVCPACDGQGVVDAPDEDDEPLICSLCDGSGKKEWDEP